jgi:integrase
MATARELHHVDASGNITSTSPNGGVAYALIGRGPFSLRAVADLHYGNGRPAVAEKDSDDALLEVYIKHRNIIGYDAKEARATWALFRTLCDKPLADCTRDDGRKLVEHFAAQGLKSKTITKKVAWLNAMVNLAIKENKLRFNPFSEIVPDMGDSVKRAPIKDADLKVIKRNLDNLSKSDQLLVRLLASTGMRLAEAYQIEGEEKENGVRFTIIGTKTDQSLRRVPFPAAVLPHLPKKITGPLFPRDQKDPADAASKRLGRFLRDDCGITDKAKVGAHSWRHRAQDKLRAAECPQDVRWALLGHEEETVAEGYGEGFSVRMLKKWVDRIGF